MNFVFERGFGMLLIDHIVSREVLLYQAFLTAIQSPNNFLFYSVGNDNTGPLMTIVFILVTSYNGYWMNIVYR